MFLIRRGKWWCHFLLLYIAFRKLLCFEALVKTMVPDRFSFPGGDLCLFCLNAALLLLPCLHHFSSFDRIKCYALQEEPNALRALLQPCSAPDDTGDGSPANGRRAMV